MSITVVAIEDGVIDLTRTRRVNAHPEWCTGLRSCETHHLGPVTRGRSWHMRGDRPEMRWNLSPKQAIDGSREARVELGLYFNNQWTDVGLAEVALTEMTAWDARAMAADLLKVAESIDAAEVSR